MYIWMILARDVCKGKTETRKMLHEQITQREDRKIHLHKSQE